MFCFQVSVNAQITVTPVTNSPGALVISNANWVEIYELPNYTGRKQVFTANAENLGLPYTPNVVSLKIKPGYKAYLKLGCQEFPFELAYDVNTPNINAGGAICGIRIAKIKRVQINYMGILTQIHNNDCKKMYGTITYSLYELNAANVKINVRTNIAASPWNVSVFQKRKAVDEVAGAVFNIADYYVADRDYITGVLSDPRRYKPLLGGAGSIQNNFFNVDDEAFQNKKVFMEVKVKIGSAHKSCDLCSGFTWDAEMIREETKIYNIVDFGLARFPNKTIQVGPFRHVANSGAVTFGGGGGFHENNTPGGGVNFTGPAHSTYIQFSVNR